MGARIQMLVLPSSSRHSLALRQLSLHLSIYFFSIFTHTWFCLSRFPLWPPISLLFIPAKPILWKHLGSCQNPPLLCALIGYGLSNKSLWVQVLRRSDLILPHLCPLSPTTRKLDSQDQDKSIFCLPKIN